MTISYTIATKMDQLSEHQLSENIMTNSYTTSPSTFASGGAGSWQWEVGHDNLELLEGAARKPIMCQSDIRQEFKLLVKNIAYSIKDLKKLTYISDHPQDEIQNTNALDILSELERKGMFAFNNISPLEKLLQDIDRFDLITKYLGPYIEMYGEAATGSQKKSQASNRVGPYSSMPLRSQATPIPQNKKHNEGLRSLPASFRNYRRSPGAKFTVVPEEETKVMEQLPQTAHHRLSLPSNATMVPSFDTSWSARSSSEIQNLSSHHRYSETANEHSKPITIHSNGQQGIHSSIASPLSLPANLSRVQQSSEQPSLPYQLCQHTGPIVKVPQYESEAMVLPHAHQVEQLSTSQDDGSILEFPHQPVSDMEASVTHSVQSQRMSMQNESGFEESRQPSATKLAGISPQRSEKTHCWDVDLRLLLNGLKKIGNSLKVEKFTFPVNCKNSRNPVVHMRLFPRETEHCHYLTLIAELVIPKKCSKRKWLVEYCSCSCKLTVKVIDLKSSKIIRQAETDGKLAGNPGVDEDYCLTLRVPELLHHDDIVYRNDSKKKLKFQATLCLLEHGFKEDQTVKNYQRPQAQALVPNTTDDDFEVIELP